MNRFEELVGIDERRTPTHGTEALSEERKAAHMARTNGEPLFVTPDSGEMQGGEGLPGGLRRVNGRTSRHAHYYQQQYRADQGTKLLLSER